MKADEMCSRLYAHSCGRKRIISADNPLSRTIGFACLGCGEDWGIPVRELKAAPKGEFKKKWLTAKGRQAMAKLFNNEGVLQIWDEVII